VIHKGLINRLIDAMAIDTFVESTQVTVSASGMQTETVLVESVFVSVSVKSVSKEAVAVGTDTVIMERIAMDSITEALPSVRVIIWMNEWDILRYMGVMMMQLAAVPCQVTAASFAVCGTEKGQ